MQLAEEWRTKFNNQLWRGNTPLQVRGGLAYAGSMKPKSFLDKSQKLTSAPSPIIVEGSDQCKIDFVPSANEVAGRAYANFLNQGSQHGHDVDNWLKAESQLQEERNLIRVGGGGFPNRT